MANKHKDPEAKPVVSETAVIRTPQEREQFVLNVLNHVLADQNCELVVVPNALGSQTFIFQISIRAKTG